MASGRRVVGIHVGGITDLFTSTLVGEMVSARRPDELAEALWRAGTTTYESPGRGRGWPGGLGRECPSAGIDLAISPGRLTSARGIASRRRRIGVHGR
jgi:hypothetical protein